MRKWHRETVLDLYNLLLAALLFVSPWLFRLTNGSGKMDLWATGAVIAVISLAAMIAAGMLRLRLLARHGPWNAFLIAAGAYLIVVVVVGLALPPVNEVAAEFPAVLLWRFRIASAGAQLIMWTTTGLLFGVLAERVLALPAGVVRYSSADSSRRRRALR